MAQMAIWTVVIFIPSNILMLYAMLTILGYRPPWRRLVGLGTVAGVSFSLFLFLTGGKGLHVLLQVILLSVIVKFTSRSRWSLAILVTMGIQLLTAVGEGLVAAPLMAVLGYDMNDLFSGTSLRTIAAWLSLLPLMAADVYLYLRTSQIAVEKG